MSIWVFEFCPRFVRKELRRAKSSRSRYWHSSPHMPLEQKLKGYTRWWSGRLSRIPFFLWVKYSLRPRNYERKLNYIVFNLFHSKETKNTFRHKTPCSFFSGKFSFFFELSCFSNFKITKLSCLFVSGLKISLHFQSFL